MTDLKSKLGNANWRKYKDTTIDVDGEELAVVIRRAPPGVAVQVLEEARKTGDVDEENNPKGESGAMRLLARMVATVLFEPGAVRPLFDRTNEEDITTITTAPWLLDISDDATAALGASGAVVEKMKGNSEATPIEH
ncbi:hypothetical protein JQX13_50400 [Archangium violaceum]|uniref:hypothetical protein n=1 Tax=Archangium violaceum TaxID=83451 RepID=UPI00193C7475|nr:hypothetical protein [Archangium violaceum]QRK08079.1 hypothetical protein JQX13_50400 [Archangium violaceum]